MLQVWTTTPDLMILAKFLKQLMRTEERLETDLNRLDCLLQTAKDRCSPSGKGYLRREVWGLQLLGPLANLQFLPPGAVCPDKAVLSLQTVLFWVSGYGS